MCSDIVELRKIEGWDGAVSAIRDPAAAAAGAAHMTVTPERQRRGGAKRPEAAPGA